MAIDRGHAKNSVRVGGRVTPDINDKIDELAKQLSISKTSIMSIIIHTGFNTMSRVVNPEEHIDYNKMANAFEVTGFDLEKMIEK